MMNYNRYLEPLFMLPRPKGLWASGVKSQSPLLNHVLSHFVDAGPRRPGGLQKNQTENDTQRWDISGLKAKANVICSTNFTPPATI